MKKEAANRKRKQIYQSLNPKTLNQKQQNGGKNCKSKNKENPSRPELDGLNPKTINWEKKLQVKKQKKIDQSLKPTVFNQSQ